MSESDREPGEHTDKLSPTGAQKAVVAGLAVVVFLLARFLQLFLFPADCEMNGAIVFAAVGLPAVFGSYFTLLAWVRGGDRLVLIREGGLFAALTVAGFMTMSAVTCHFQNALHGFAVSLPLFATVMYFASTRVARVCFTAAFPDNSPEDKAEKEGGAP